MTPTAARDLLVILLAEVANTYIDVRSAQARLRYARQNVGIQQGTLKLAQDRLDTGVGSDLQVAQAERNLATTRSDIPTLQEGLARVTHRLATLVAAPPSELLAQLEAEKPIPMAEPSLAVGIPADLLRRRPDLRRAERSLAAQTSQIGASTAELYPQLSLDGCFARVAYEGEKLTESGSDDWLFGPSFRWNEVANALIEHTKTGQVREAQEQYEFTLADQAARGRRWRPTTR